MALSNIEIHWLIEEMEKSLLNGWFQKIWKLEDGYKMRIRTNENQDVIIKPPDAVFITRYSYETVDPNGLIMKIRKELGNAKLTEINQPNFDRLIEFKFSSGHRIIVELFSKGNLIFVGPDGKTLAAHRYESWSDRVIRPNKEYNYPSSSGLNPFEMTLDEFSKIFGERDIIRSLVRNVKLGNTYLEEVCRLAGEDKNAKEPKDVERLYNAVKEIAERYSPGIQEMPVLFKIGDGEFEPTSTFSEALDKFWSPKETKTVKKEKTDKIGKLRARLKEQENILRQMEEDSVKYKQIGDKIYEHYQDLEALMSKIRELRKQGKDWREIELELGIKINEKEGTFVVDLE